MKRIVAFYLFFLFCNVFTGLAQEKTLIRNKSLIQVKHNQNASPYHVHLPKEFTQRMLTKSDAMQMFKIEFLEAGNTYAREWGDEAIAWPEKAKKAFQEVARIWGSVLNIKVPVKVKAVWCGNMDEYVLGHAGATSFWGNKTVAWPVSLANQLDEKDLDPTDADIYCAFNSKFLWHYDLKDSVPEYKSDLVSVVLHELGHGLGFIGGMNKTLLDGSYEFKYSYDLFTEDLDGNKLIDTVVYANPSTELGKTLTSGEVFFNGPYASGANDEQRVPLYVPRVWSNGSSYSHLANSFMDTPNALMCYAIGRGQSIHFPGYVTLGILKDQGWNINLDSINIFLPPVAKPATDITKNSLLAQWEATKDAEGYVLEVYASKQSTKDAPNTDIGIAQKTGIGGSEDANQSDRKLVFTSKKKQALQMEVTGLENNTNYEYRVKAYKGKLFTTSNWVFAKTLGEPTHSEKIKNNDYKVMAIGGNCLQISNAAEKKCRIFIYNASGQLLQKDIIAMGSYHYELPSTGIYFVKIKTETYRINVY